MLDDTEYLDREVIRSFDLEHPNRPYTDTSFGLIITDEEASDLLDQHVKVHYTQDDLPYLLVDIPRNYPTINWDQGRTTAQHANVTVKFVEWIHAGRIGVRVTLVRIEFV